MVSVVRSKFAQDCFKKFELQEGDLNSVVDTFVERVASICSCVRVSVCPCVSVSATYLDLFNYHSAQKL